MFMGTFYNSIDNKNRMIVPAKHRDQLGGKCILTTGLDECLNIYSMDNWEKQMEKMETLPESDPTVRSFIRHTYANAVECEFDRQGRIIIPPTLKDYAGIEKELVTMGAMKKIEIWSAERWNAEDNDARMDTSDYSEALKKYNY